jgi:type II secretory pathway predicted ATPase ExeA
MYETYYGLCRRPFSAVAEPVQYFPARAIETARKGLVGCIQHGAGPGVLIGPPGTGKTLLCYLLRDQFRHTFRVALVSRGSLDTRRALLQAILSELDQPCHGLDDAELWLALVQYVIRPDQCPHGLLLVLDEAQLLPLPLLEEIRLLLTNLAAEVQPPVRLILSGDGRLEQHLASPTLESLSLRIAVRSYLEPFSRAETQEYIRVQLGKAGGNAENIFLPAACQRVYDGSGGVPCLVNRLCDRALAWACAAGRRPVDAACVEQAWAELEELPAPWNLDAPAAGPLPPAGHAAVPSEGQPLPAALPPPRPDALDPFCEPFQEEEVIAGKFAAGAEQAWPGTQQPAPADNGGLPAAEHLRAPARREHRAEPAKDALPAIVDVSRRQFATTLERSAFERLVAFMEALADRYHHQGATGRREILTGAGADMHDILGAAIERRNSQDRLPALPVRYATLPRVRLLGGPTLGRRESDFLLGGPGDGDRPTFATRQLRPSLS